MKKSSLLFVIAWSLCLPISATDLIVKVTNVKNATGSVLIMAQSATSDEPVYGMAKAEKGTTTVTFENIQPGSYNLSIMHDENGNMQMDMDESGRPTEAYAMKKVTVAAETQTLQTKLFYPTNE